jgi:hypothetical protein
MTLGRDPCVEEARVEVGVATAAEAPRPTRIVSVTRRKRRRAAYMTGIT